MRKTLEILRLAHECQWSTRRIAESVGTPRSTVSDHLSRFQATGLTWPLPPDMDRVALEARLFARTSSKAVVRPLPEWPAVHSELRKDGVTLDLLWQEYKRDHPDGYQYTRFCHLYHAWAATVDPVLRQLHPGGERVFVDYAGQTVEIVDASTGEVRTAQIFVGALGASNFFYVEATWTQSLPDWIGSHVRMLAYFGGAPALIVPDNLKAGVRQACYYEPDINPTYHDLAVHYGTTILPARAYHPRDKAKVETAVQIVERWVLAPLRNHRFSSLAELNLEIRHLREVVNDRPFQKLAGTRRTLFAALDQPALRPLPPTPYEYADWRRARVNIDYHISVEKHFYSVPYTLVRAEVDVRLTSTMIEVLHAGKRVAVHVRRSGKGGYTTDPAHLSKSHRAHAGWTPSRLIRWGSEIGTATGAVVTAILERQPHPEQGYRSCLGLLSLSRRYSPARLDAACQRALTTGATSYKSVKSILVTGLDRLSTDPDAVSPTLVLPTMHEHVRGAGYYRVASSSDATDSNNDSATAGAVSAAPTTATIEAPC